MSRMTLVASWRAVDALWIGAIPAVWWCKEATVALGHAIVRSRDRRHLRRARVSSEWLRAHQIESAKHAGEG